MRMERFVWLVIIVQQEELNCATTTSGEQCVMTWWMLMRLESSAGNFNCHLRVSDGAHVEGFFYDCDNLTSIHA